MIISVILLFVIWTWGFTPLWVNIVASSLIGVYLSLQVLKIVLELVYDED